MKLGTHRTWDRIPKERMTAQIERQTDEPQFGDRAGPIEVLLLIAAPAVDEQHRRAGAHTRDQPGLDLLIINRDLDRLVVNCHKLWLENIW